MLLYYEVGLTLFSFAELLIVWLYLQSLLTQQHLRKHQVLFHLLVEDNEMADDSLTFSEHHTLVLPVQNYKEEVHFSLLNSQWFNLFLIFGVGS